MGDINDIIDSENANKKSVSLQGFEAKPDFPQVDIVVADDKREKELFDQDW